MSEIPEYPLPSGSLDGSELVVGWAGGLTRRITTASIAALMVTLNPGGFIDEAAARAAITAPSDGLSYNSETGALSLSLDSQIIESGLGYTPVQSGTGIGQAPGHAISIGWDGTSSFLAAVDGGTSVRLPQLDTTINPHLPVFNIDGYQDNALVQQAANQFSTPTAFGYDGSGIGVGMGWIYIHRHHLGYVATNVLTNAGSTGSGGGSVAMDGITCHVGGPSHNSVVEARSDFVIYDQVSPNCTNPNTVAHQTRAFCMVSGTTAGGLMSMFGNASYVVAGPGGDNVNLCGMEIDVGTTNNSATSTNRAGITCLSMGNTSGSIESGLDAAFNAVVGPQFNGIQTSGKAGWGAALLIRNLGSATGFDNPISTNGYVIKFIGTYTIKTIFDFSGITASSAIMLTPTVNWTPSLFALTTASQRVAIGSLSAAGTSVLDLVTGTGMPTYGARISAAGGNTVDGSAALTIASGNLKMPAVVGFGVAPVATQTITGAKGGNAALASVVALLKNIGLGIDSTTA